MERTRAIMVGEWSWDAAVLRAEQQQLVQSMAEHDVVIASPLHLVLSVVV